MAKKEKEESTRAKRLIFKVEIDFGTDEKGKALRPNRVVTVSSTSGRGAIKEAMKKTEDDVFAVTVQESFDSIDDLLETLEK